MAEPIRVTICHCRFCQRATGAAYMVEPIFRLADLRSIHGAPTVYERRSDGSGKLVRIHFCPACGTKLWLSFERFPDAVGVYAGTFDEPGWFDITPGNAKQIFTSLARPDTILMPGVPAYREHAIGNDGSPCEAVVRAEPYVVGRRR
jgi:hypothetical protein